MKQASAPATSTKRLGPRIKPITIGCYTLHATGITVRGRPSFGEHEGVGDFIKRAHKASGFWLADWLRYGDERSDWKARLSQAVDATDLSEKTLKNVRAVGAMRVRREDVDFGNHAELAALSEREQERWLEKCATEGWDRRELRLHLRVARRAKVIEGQAVLEGMYRVIYSDNPWIYDDRQPSGSSSGAHFPGMTIEEQCKLPVGAHALPNSVLFMWVTAPLILSNPGPREVGEAWGFTYKQQRIWDKVDGTHSYYTGGNHEILTIWTRGSCTPDLPTDLGDSIEIVRKSREHSAKPEAFRDWIMKHWTTGPYLELFGRHRVPGWTVWGNDARLWPTQTAQQATA